MKVLIVGSGAREHALGWAISRSPQCTDLLFAPGNGGTRHLGRNLPITADYTEGIVAAARGEAVDLVVIGPEAPLVAGLADALREHGIAVFGPGADGAQLEGSKHYAKQFMEAATIPSAKYASFTEAEPAVAYVRAHGAPIVIKADGLAAGKGVVVASSVAEAEDAIHSMLDAGTFGAAGSSIVIEEYLDGVEATVMALVAGDRYEILATSRDHKRAYDGDTGPNTGGMGAVSPAPDMSDDVLARVREEILTPAIAELARRGIDYRGVLYVGVMICADGPKVVEFNARFGDPETQVIVPRLQSDVLPVMLDVARGVLDPSTPVRWTDKTAVGVVVAASGYPASVEVGDEIVIDTSSPELYFHGGTRTLEGKLLTAGGRVVTVVGIGEDIGFARDCAYNGVKHIEFRGAWSRSDIPVRSATSAHRSHDAHAAIV